MFSHPISRCAQIALYPLAVVAKSGPQKKKHATMVETSGYVCQWKITFLINLSCQFFLIFGQKGGVQNFPPK